MVPTVAFSDVVLALNGRFILDKVTMMIAPGEFIGVLGPNGAGKTTFMRAILGLLRPVSGEIVVFGVSPRRGHSAIGYMPQASHWPPRLGITVDAFLALGVKGERWGMPGFVAARREVGRVLELVGAKTLERRLVDRLSGGERQRLLLAQALIGRPQLLLLDEPFNNLDLNNRDLVIRLIDTVRQELGITVLCSSHEISPLLPVMSRVLCFGNGTFKIGSVDEVITGPVLSRLYGLPINVIRRDEQILVASATLPNS